MTDSGKKTKCGTSLSRRGFLKTGAALTGAAVAAPLFIPASALGRDGRPAPSERVTLAGIGVGGMGQIDSGNFVGVPECQIVAVCDVDTAHFEPVRGNIERWYAAQADLPNYKGCATYTDFRDVLAREDVDAVYIAAPDHWHARIGMAAAAAGKDIYGEKPMTLTIADGRRLVNAVTRHNRVFQHGTQSRSDARIRRVAELVRNGRIGRVERVRVGIPAGLQGPEEGPEPIPQSLDYQRWLGPAPDQPFHSKRTHFWFRWVMDFSDGPITDLGTHYLDVTKWACGHDLTGPVEIEGWGNFPRTGIYDAAIHGGFTMKWADGVIYDVSTRYPLGPRFEGTSGWIHIPMSHPLPTEPITASDPRILDSRLEPGETRLYQSDNHWANFVHCVKSRGETAAPAEVGHRSTTLPHLGTIAMKTGRKLFWNPEEEKFRDDPEANAMLDRPEHERMREYV